jgi:hypothetical protein
MSLKTKTTSPKDYEEKLKDWARRLWIAISNEGKYREVHEDFFKEFNNLRDEGQGITTWVMTLINHVAPIYDHIASQSYTSHIHYKPLRDAVTNFCEGKPVTDWKGPADQFSRTPSPHLPSRPPSLAGPSKKKTHAAILEGFVLSERDESEKELPKHESVKVKQRKAATDATKSHNAEGVDTKSLPNTEGMERCPTKCSKCATRKHGCHVNPKATKAAAACFECNHWRLKCSLAATRANAKKGEDEAPTRANAKKGEDEAPTRANAAKADDEEEAAPPPKRRKKPTQVPAGQPGPSTTGEPIFHFF